MKFTTHLHLRWGKELVELRFFSTICLHSMDRGSGRLIPFKVTNTVWTSHLNFHCTGTAVCLFIHKSSLLSTGLTVFTLWLIYSINCRGMFYCARFDVLAVAPGKIQIFWDIMLCHCINGPWWFDKSLCLHLHSQAM